MREPGATPQVYVAHQDEALKERDYTVEFTATDYFAALRLELRIDLTRPGPLAQAFTLRALGA